MAKLENYVELAAQTVREIAADGETWRSFLQTASTLYKYSFYDQMMIYAQRPDATACASFELWTNTMRRYVRRGAKGIALLDMTGDVPRYRYVFDISDTGTRQNARTPFTWTIREENSMPIAAMLEKEYEVSANRGLAGQFEEIAMQKAMDYWQEHQDELRDIVDGSLLMEYDELNLELAFRNTAGTKTVTLYCDLGWTASTTDSWIQVSPSSGSAGTVELSVSVTENGGVEERSGAVNLHVDGDFLIEIPVKQSGLYMDMTESRFDFESGAASRTVSMSTNLSFWNVLEKPSWVSVSPESGEAGEHTLTINVEDNPNTTKREGRVVVGNQGLSLADTLWVTQEGKSFGPLETVLQFENVASSNTLDISTDGDWTVTTSDGWITVAPSSGHGNGQVTVTVEANETDNERTGLLSVAVGGTVQYVNVVQKGRYFTIDRGPSASLPSKGGTIELGIATNQAWTAAVKNQSSWLALSATQGQGDAKLVISAQDNSSLESRTDTIVFTPANKQGVKLAVKQAGRYLKTDAQAVSFFYKGGTSAPVTVSTDGTFRVEKSSGADWLVVATNNNLLMFTAEPYSGNDKRTATVSLYLTGLSGEASEAKMVDIVVTQYSKNTQFVRDDYGEDVRLDVTYKDGALIIRSDYGEDKDLSPAPGTSGEISRDDYGTDQNLEQ